MVDRVSVAVLSACSRGACMRWLVHGCPLRFVPDDSVGSATERLEWLILRIDRELACIHHERMVAGTSDASKQHSSA